MADKTEHEARMATAIAATVEFREDMTGQFALLPDGYRVESLEKFQEEPNRMEGRKVFVGLDSFIRYVEDFKRAGTIIEADYDKTTITATLDWHEPGSRIPGWGKHIAQFDACLDQVLAAWLAVSDKDLEQTTFGLFLEDHAIDVVKPDPADIMEMVMKFDAIKKVSFKSSTRLHDGQRQFVYSEENEVRGTVTLPDHIIIQCPIFRGQEPQDIKFMLRYRIMDEKLKFKITMHDRHRVMRGAFDKCVDAVKLIGADHDGTGGTFVYEV